jgi:hypothetical protein
MQQVIYMKKVGLLIVAIILTQMVFAQKKKDVAKGQLKYLKAIYAKVGNYTDSLFMHTNRLNKCKSGYLFIYFSIDEAGHLKKIQTNEGTPVFLDSIFKEALSASDNLWKLTKRNKTYMLPVAYRLSNGCPIDTSSRKLSALEWKIKQLPDFNNLQSSDSEASFLNMTNLNNKKTVPGNIIYPAVDCLLLTPFELVTPSY